MLPTVVCVLKSGLWKPRQDRDYSVSYGAHHVQWLAEQFACKIATPHRFVCLTDIEIPGVETRPLQDGLPGWWSKLEIFREFRHACYVDLDTVIVGDVSRYLFAPHRFTVSAGINLMRNGAINSSLMCWEGDFSSLYYGFMKRRERIIETYTCNAQWGDQGYIRDAARGRISFEYFQSRFPGSVLQYKRDFLCTTPERPYKSVYSPVKLETDWQSTPRIVFFNGELKPWQVDEPWIPKCAA